MDEIWESAINPQMCKMFGWRPIGLTYFEKLIFFVPVAEDKIQIEESVWIYSLRIKTKANKGI